MIEREKAFNVCELPLEEALAPARVGQSPKMQ